MINVNLQMFNFINLLNKNLSLCKNQSTHRSGIKKKLKPKEIFTVSTADSTYPECVRNY